MRLHLVNKIQYFSSTICLTGVLGASLRCEAEDFDSGIENWSAMGKFVPVKLDNGRSWPQKGMARKHFSEMLGRYVVGERVLNAVDNSDLTSLLKVYDATVPAGDTKAGCGIAYFEKGVDLDHPGNTVCFYVVRTNKTRTDFSLGRALDAAAAATAAAI